MLITYWSGNVLPPDGVARDCLLALDREALSAPPIMLDKHYICNEAQVSRSQESALDQGRQLAKTKDLESALRSCYHLTTESSLKHYV
jgi:hypothetical protein